MLTIERRRARWLALRDFAIGQVVLAAMGGIPLWLFATSPLEALQSGPLRLFLLSTIGVAWLVGGGAIVWTMFRGLTVVRMETRGLVVRGKVVPYNEIRRINRRLGSLVFEVETATGKTLDMSKIGIEQEEPFFQELDRRIRELGRSHEEGGTRPRNGVK